MSTDTRQTATVPTGASVPFAVAGLLYLALIGYITLGPVPWQSVTNEGSGGVLSPATWLDPVTWTTGGPLEFVANIILFVPVGVLLRRAFPRLPAVGAVAVGVVLTLSIEVLQIPLDRVSDPRDLVANTAGALLGTVLTLGRRGAPARSGPPAAVAPRCS
ncbi:VanZ family protein [Desertihabitans aurantiacus]|uniref:VanZ family protein n=1 Tax=Desertihabitans aurantiacus TaxID=2282477 RepID=UPI000DF808E7|nr:VanZ family protein [Desertihabitans aurantiacus]